MSRSTTTWRPRPTTATALCAPLRAASPTSRRSRSRCRAATRSSTWPRARGATGLAAFVSRAKDGEPLTIAGSGEQTRRFIYVEDLAQGVVKALRTEAANRTYNLAGTEETTILQVAEAVRDTVGGTE